MYNQKIANIFDHFQDRSRLGLENKFLENKSRRIFLRSTGLLCKFLPINLGVFKLNQVCQLCVSCQCGRVFERHRYDDIIMGFYGKAFDNGLQAKAAGSKPILFPANQNLGRSGLYHS